MTGKTRKINQTDNLTVVAEPKIKPIDLGMPRPWRIALRLLDFQVELIFDLEDSITIGRAHAETNYFPEIDLGPFNGGDMGVSREHVYIRLDDERVVIVDNKSANGTKLNGQRLKAHEAYPLRHGDEIALGLMKIQVELLTDPFN